MNSTLRRGPETYTKYEVAVAFTENESDYWHTLTQKLLTSFWNSDTWNKPVDLFLIKMEHIKLGDKCMPASFLDCRDQQTPFARILK